MLHLILSAIADVIGLIGFSINNKLLGSGCMIGGFIFTISVPFLFATFKHKRD